MAVKMACSGTVLRRFVFIAAAAVLGGAWVTLDAAKVRLVDGGLTQGHRLAGIQIELDPGWKTYWRVPGEFGVPPAFDWSGSDNLKHAEVFFPAPTRLVDQGGEAIGYEDQGGLPGGGRGQRSGKAGGVEARPAFRRVPGDLRPGGSGAGPDPPGSAGARCRGRAGRRGAGQGAGGSRRRPRSDRGKSPAGAGGEGYELVVRLEGSGANEADIFVEDFPDAYFGKPRPLETAGRSASYRLPVVGLKQPEQLVGKALTLTVVAGDNSVVRSVAVGGAGK